MSAVYACSEVMDRTELLRAFYNPFVGTGPGAAGLEHCGGSFARGLNGEMVIEKYLVRLSLFHQIAELSGAPSTFCWIRDQGNPAGSLTR